jgi:uncharacterized protein (TIGR00369 family)
MPIKGVDWKHLSARLRPMFENNPFADHFDLEVISVLPGEAVLRFPYRKEFTQYQGSVQGGVVVAYADAALAVAIAQLVEEGRDFVTTDLNVQYVRAATSGPFLARGKVEHQGRSLLRGSATVEIEGVGIIAYCMATFMVVSPRRPT